MDDKTELLIRELAEKLGTTGNHLWGVLLQQAVITAVANILVFTGWAALLFFSFRFLLSKTKTPETEDDEYLLAELPEEFVFILWVLWCFAFIVGVVLVGLNLSNTAAAIFNPEFWALKQIIG